MKKVFFIIYFCFICIYLYSSTIWRDRNVYSTEGQPAVGDIVVVKITDFSKFKYEVKLNNASSREIISNPDITITGFLPNISSNRNIKNNEITSFSGNSNMEMSIAATITGTENNGHAVISGVRSYSFNGVVTTVAINGIVDPKFIDAGSVNSNHVSNFAIQITGRKDGLVVRPVPLEEGGTASLQLTEAEKQRIIIDYLEKIVRELTR